MTEQPDPTDFESLLQPDFRWPTNPSPPPINGRTTPISTSTAMDAWL